MDRNYLISIIVPIYNVEQYLPRCIDSLIRQTYRNIEIILVDDGSPDSCGEICEEYSKKDNRIKVIHKQNGGLSDARNAGLDIAQGDYLLFVDSDDWIEDETCETVLKFAIENKADIVPFGIAKVYENGTKKIQPIKLQKEVASAECIKALIYKVEECGLCNYAWNKLYSSILFEDLRFPKGLLYEDQGITYKLFHKSKRICVCHKKLYNYYQRNNSITGGGEYYPKQINDRLFLWMERLEFLKSYYPQLVDYQIAQILGVAYVSLIKLKRCSEYKNFQEKIRCFVKENKIQEKYFVSYDKKVKLHYYCYPLFWLYVKLFIK